MKRFSYKILIFLGNCRHKHKNAAYLCIPKDKHLANSLRHKHILISFLCFPVYLIQLMCLWTGGAEYLKMSDCIIHPPMHPSVRVSICPSIYLWMSTYVHCASGLPSPCFCSLSGNVRLEGNLRVSSCSSYQTIASL